MTIRCTQLVLTFFPLITLIGCDQNYSKDQSTSSNRSQTSETDTTNTENEEESSSEFTIAQSGRVKLGDEAIVEWDSGTVNETVRVTLRKSAIIDESKIDSVLIGDALSSTIEVEVVSVASGEVVSSDKLQKSFTVIQEIETDLANDSIRPLVAAKDRDKSDERIYFVAKNEYSVESELIRLQLAARRAKFTSQIRETKARMALVEIESAPKTSTPGAGSATGSGTGTSSGTATGSSSQNGTEVDEFATGTHTTSQTLTSFDASFGTNGILLAAGFNHVSRAEEPARIATLLENGDLLVLSTGGDSSAQQYPIVRKVTANGAAINGYLLAGGTATHGVAMTVIDSNIYIAFESATLTAQHIKKYSATGTQDVNFGIGGTVNLTRCHSEAGTCKVGAMFPCGNSDVCVYYDTGKALFTTDVGVAISKFDGGSGSEEGFIGIENQYGFGTGAVARSSDGFVYATFSDGKVTDSDFDFNVLKFDKTNFRFEPNWGASATLPFRAAIDSTNLKYTPAGTVTDSTGRLVTFGTQYSIANNQPYGFISRMSRSAVIDNTLGTNGVQTFGYTQNILNLAALPNGRMALVPEGSANSLQVQMLDESGAEDTRFGASGTFIVQSAAVNFTYRTGMVRYVGGGWMYIIGTRIDSNDSNNPQFMVIKAAIN